MNKEEFLKSYLLNHQFFVIIEYGRYLMISIINEK